MLLSLLLLFVLVCHVPAGDQDSGWWCSECPAQGPDPQVPSGRAHNGGQLPQGGLQSDTGTAAGRWAVLQLQQPLNAQHLVTSVACT